tara:strand:+ start:1698 stop:2477 length:780 start_codon:yes stop_codon:yes gene_type:complete
MFIKDKGEQMLKNIYLSIFTALSITPISANAYDKCANADTEYSNTYKVGYPFDAQTDLIKKESPLTPSGKVKCIIGFNYLTLDSNTKDKIESGSLNLSGRRNANVKYRIYYSDGGGSVQGLKTNNTWSSMGSSNENWGTGCYKDEMDDTRYCQLSKEGLAVGIWKDGSSFITIGHSHYPGSNVTLRIDKGKPIIKSEEHSFTNAQSDDIINALKSGKTVLTRYQEWPYQRNIDTSVDLYGFIEAWSLLNTLFNASAPEK